ncbi:MAG: cysteine desulfurase [Planctomycetota bacterium]
MNPIEFDQNATTRPAEAVIDAMAPWLAGKSANPSSPYRRGEEAARALRDARAEVAALLGAKRANEVVFTSGGSESITSAFSSTAFTVRGQGQRRRILLSQAEHSASKSNAERLAAFGFEVVWLPVDAAGRVSAATLNEQLDDRTAIVSLILANNETGVLTDFSGIADACRAAGAVLHIDAVQGPGKIAIDVSALGADFVSISAHKFHGPQGVGALWVREGVEFHPLIVGGPQERDRRAGTENIAGAVGLGTAARLARERVEGQHELHALAALRDRLEAQMLDLYPSARINGSGVPRTPNTSNVTFPGIDGPTLLLLLAAEGLECSAGSACNAQKVAPSPVLLAMGVDEEDASSSLRFSLSAHSRERDLERALEILKRSLTALTSL